MALLTRRPVWLQVNNFSSMTILKFVVVCSLCLSQRAQSQPTNVPNTTVSAPVTPVNTTPPVTTVTPAPPVTTVTPAPPVASVAPPSAPPAPPVQCQYRLNGSSTIELSQSNGTAGYPVAGVLYTSGNTLITVANSGNCSFIDDTTGELDDACDNQFYFNGNVLCSQVFQAAPKEKQIFSYMNKHVRLNITHVFVGGNNYMANNRSQFCVEFHTSSVIRQG